MDKLEWLFYNSLLPLSPILGVWFLAWISRGTNKDILLIIKDGQVFFYCAAMISVALGDFDLLPSTFEYQAAWFMGFLFALLFSTLAFGAAALDSTGIDHKKYGTTSIFTAFSVTVLVLLFRIEGNLL